MIPLNPNLQYPLALLGSQAPADQAQTNQQYADAFRQQQLQRYQQIQALQGAQNATSSAATMSPTEVLARALSGGLSGAILNRAQNAGSSAYQLPAAQNPNAGSGGYNAGNFT